VSRPSGLESCGRPGPTPRDAGFPVSFGCVWPPRLALKYKGEVDCYEVEQGASLPLLRQLGVTHGPHTPVHPAHTLASPLAGDWRVLAYTPPPPTHNREPYDTLLSNIMPL
jgi:hypothetical protein